MDYFCKSQLLEHNGKRREKTRKNKFNIYKEKCFEQDYHGTKNELIIVKSSSNTGFSIKNKTSAIFRIFFL